MQSLVSSSVTTGSGAGGSHEAASICCPGSGAWRGERVAWGEGPGGGPSPAAGTGGAEHLPSAPPGRAGERTDGQLAALQAGLEPVMGKALGSPGRQRQGRRDAPIPIPMPSRSRHCPLLPAPAEALTWKRFFTQIFFMLLQSPAGPVTPAQARQDASPLPAGSPLSARRGDKRCSEHPPPPAAGDGGGKRKGLARLGSREGWSCEHEASLECSSLHPSPACLRPRLPASPGTQ